jgi:hypothetical protein
VRQIGLVLRLVADQAACGRVVGQVEVIDTGERVMVRSVDELESLIARLSLAPDSFPASSV